MAVTVVQLWSWPFERPPECHNGHMLNMAFDLCPHFWGHIHLLTFTKRKNCHFSRQSSQPPSLLSQICPGDKPNINFLSVWKLYTTLIKFVFEDLLKTSLRFTVKESGEFPLTPALPSTFSIVNNPTRVGHW